jgi:hypothetical protein
VSDESEHPVQQLLVTLVNRAGGYLRNTVRIPGRTCPVCSTTTNPGYSWCRACDGHRSFGTSRPTADHVGILTYAVEGKQSHYLMRGYKASEPVSIQEHRSVVTLLAFAGLYLHMECLGRIASLPVTHWTSVPSLPAKPGEHPLHQILGPIMVNIPEIPLTAAVNVSAPRAFRDNHFFAAYQLPYASHVLVIDDTWTSGGHAQSAALAVKFAGASKVSILSLARYFRESYGDNEKFASEYLTQDYDPRRCPWRPEGCPA